MPLLVLVTCVLEGYQVAHLQDLATAHLAHVHGQLVRSLLQELVAAAPLRFSVAAVVVHDLLPVQE